MKLNLTPPGGDPTPVMTPEERKIWLASHNAPKDMLLLTEAEYKRVTIALINEHGTRVGHEAGIAILMMILTDYCKTEPDLRHAAAAAVFDAGRYKKGVDIAAKNLGRTKERLDSLIASQQKINFALAADLLTVSEELGDTIKFLEAQAALRRDRAQTPNVKPSGGNHG